MYDLLTNKQYNNLSEKYRLKELHKWLESQLENHRSVLRSIAGVTMEDDPDIEEVIGAEYSELGQLINKYDDSSAAKAIYTYRLENNVEECDDSILDLDFMGIITAKLCLVCVSEEGWHTIISQRSFDKDMINNCRILCLNDLEKSFDIWYPYKEDL